MRALAIDTATDVLAIAAVNGEARVSLALRKGLQHSPTLVPLLERLLAEISLPVKDLDLIACSVGPGSFTGIRIGLATAQGIGLATGVPLVGVSTLDALARPFQPRAGDVFAVLDARKGKVYTASYSGAKRTSGYLDLSPAELRAALEEADDPLLVGPDAERIREMAFPRGTPEETAREEVPYSTLFDPAALLAIGMERFARDGADPSGPHPLYLRRSEAEIEGERKR
ncbi:MAG: tRNA (adenosine(37)-N6)-threonylcarbamoyltransferase complex dimerization subunit type 1 TsaB [Spirochaetes bacterium]|nr:tRNA (adenosine(37)-N6)-threonylcarbamoyltransferase complex dimerization subunit type 1 TsaB [Spirochaetota bacterium]